MCWPFFLKIRIYKMTGIFMQPGMATVRAFNVNCDIIVSPELQSVLQLHSSRIKHSVDVYPQCRPVAELFSSMGLTLYISYTNLCLRGEAKALPLFLPLDLMCVSKRAKKNDAQRQLLSLTASMGTLGQAACKIHHHSQFTL